MQVVSGYRPCENGVELWQWRTRAQRDPSSPSDQPRTSTLLSPVFTTAASRHRQRCGCSDVVLLVGPAIRRELFPFGWIKAGAALGFDGAEFDDALAVESGRVGAVARVDGVDVEARSAFEVVTAAFAG